MSTTLQQKVEEATTLVEALALISADGQQGTLVIVSGEIVGRLKIAAGNITAAKIDSSGEEDKEAFRVLAQVTSGRFELLTGNKRKLKDTMQVPLADIIEGKIDFPVEEEEEEEEEDLPQEAAEEPATSVWEETTSTIEPKPPAVEEAESESQKEEGLKASHFRHGRDYIPSSVDTPSAPFIPRATSIQPPKVIWISMLAGCLTLLLFLPAIIKAGMEHSESLSAIHQPPVKREDEKGTLYADVLRMLFYEPQSDKPKKKDSKQQIVSAQKAAELQAISYRLTDVSVSRIAVANQFIQAGNLDSGIEIYRGLLHDEPRLSEVRMALIEAYIAKKDKKSARLLIIEGLKKTKSKEEWNRLHSVLRTVLID